jgi:hypothetical protein
MAIFRISRRGAFRNCHRLYQFADIERPEVGCHDTVEAILGSRVHKFFFFGLLMATLLGASCHRRTVEDEVVEAIDPLFSLAEKRDLSAILAVIAEDFRDFQDRDKAGLGSLLASYFEGRTGIVAHKLGLRIKNLEAGRADVEAEVALSSGGAEALRRLVRISPDVYRLRLELSRTESRWFIRYAEWSSIGLDGLFPESLIELKRIFPRLKAEL